MNSVDFLLVNLLLEIKDHEDLPFTGKIHPSSVTEQSALPDLSIIRQIKWTVYPPISLGSFPRLWTALRMLEDIESAQ